MDGEAEREGSSSKGEKGMDLKNIYSVNTQTSTIIWVDSGSESEKNEGIEDDCRAVNLDDWRISSTLKHIYILLHGIMPGRDAPDTVASYVCLPHCCLCCFSETHLFRRREFIYGAHRVFFYYHHLLYAFPEKDEGLAETNIPL